MILRNIDLNSDEWCDLIFAGKNKKYGAYYLRKTSSKRHLKALLLVIAGCVLFMLVFILTDIIRSREQDDINLKSVDITSLILLQNTVDDNQIALIEKPSPKKNEKSESLNISPENAPQVMAENLTGIGTSNDSVNTSHSSVKDSLSERREELARSGEDKNSDEAFNQVDSIPEFPGGKSALLRYIYQNIKYPPEAQNKHIEGQVFCTFVINENGRVSDVTLIEGIYPVLDEEVLRVIRSMPVWRPARKSGKAIKVRCFVPVTFKL
ncbi:MAG: TonB family protein [Candidatus Azobacteroides sp.]|nr:TonB family protein [Candidatus Azobacteroides sp.]